VTPSSTAFASSSAPVIVSIDFAGAAASPDAIAAATFCVCFFGLLRRRRCASLFGSVLLHPL